MAKGEERDAVWRCSEKNDPFLEMHLQTDFVTAEHKKHTLDSLGDGIPQSRCRKVQQKDSLFRERLLQDDGQETAFEGVSLERTIVKVGQLLLLSDEDDADEYWRMIDKHDSTEEGEDADKRVENNQKIFFCFLVFIFLFVLRMGLRKSFGDFTVRNPLCVARDI